MLFVSKLKNAFQGLSVGFYLTYEELKHTGRGYIRILIPQVFILLMRNWTAVYLLCW